MDGLARGITAFGSSLVSGVVGVFTEPVAGAVKGGASGFFSGIGKGFTGLFVKPVAGTVAFAEKTAEGFKNTPSTVVSVGQRLGKVEKPTRHFGLPLRESIDKSKRARRRHVLLHVSAFFSGEGKETFGVFTQPFNETQVLDWRVRCVAFGISCVLSLPAAACRAHSSFILVFRTQSMMGMIWSLKDIPPTTLQDSLRFAKSYHSFPSSRLTFVVAAVL